MMVAGTQTWLREVRELLGMAPKTALLHAFDWLPEGVKRRAVVAVVFRGTPAPWALAYAVTRGLRNAVWLVAR